MCHDLSIPISHLTISCSRSYNWSLIMGLCDQSVKGWTWSSLYVYNTKSIYYQYFLIDFPPKDLKRSKLFKWLIEIFKYFLLYFEFFQTHAKFYGQTTMVVVLDKSKKKFSVCSILIVQDWVSSLDLCGHLPTLCCK